jgi:hypothetical protein
MVTANIAYPIPCSIPVDRLGLPNGAAKLFQGENERWVPKHINTPRAFRFAQATRFGTHFETELHRKTWGTIRDNFFPGIPFYRRDGELRPRQVRLSEGKEFADGDTARVTKFWTGTQWITFKRHWSVRMDGIDTPESNPSSKMTEVVDTLYKYLRSEYGISNAIANEVKEIIELRVKYLGKIAGLATTAFAAHFADIGISLAPAYSRTASDFSMCDTLDLADKYGRLIGRIMAGKPSEGEDLIAGFMEAALPAYMAEAGKVLHMEYELKVVTHTDRLESWKASSDPRKRELYNILSFESAPKPHEIFSAKETARMSGIWRNFVKGNPDARNDLQTMLAFIGVAYTYQKYRGHKTPLDLMAEAYALGRAPRVKGRHGLTNDVIYRLMRPSMDPSDPDRSPMWVRYYKKDKPLHPPDCCDVLGCY